MNPNKSFNVMDVMMNNMESTIAERTAELREEKSKTEELLHGKKKNVPLIY